MDVRRVTLAVVALAGAVAANLCLAQPNQSRQTTNVAVVPQAATVAAVPQVAANPAPPRAPSWDALSDTAHDIVVSQYSSEEIATQIDVKTRNLRDLAAQKAALLKQKDVVTAEGFKAMQEVDKITDPQLRDETLLRIKSGKDVRIKTINAALAAVDSSVQRDEKELAALQRNETARQSEARLYGAMGSDGTTYSNLLSETAGRVRSSEQDAFEQMRTRRLRALAAVVLPRVEPVAPTISEAVRLSPQ